MELEHFNSETLMIWSNITSLTWLDVPVIEMRNDRDFERKNLMQAARFKPLTFQPTRISQFSWPPFLTVALPSTVPFTVWALRGGHQPLLGAIAGSNGQAPARTTQGVNILENRRANPRYLDHFVATQGFVQRGSVIDKFLEKKISRKYLMIVARVDFGESASFTKNR